jgi:N-formylglutamate amidohydrolase
MHPNDGRSVMTLPFVISIPHCSSRIPEELRPALALNEAQIRDAADTATKDIFSSLLAKAVIWSQWNRIVVDLNRSPDRRDPQGVIAQLDYHGRAIYRKGWIPDEREVERRIQKYYRPYHERLRAALEEPGTVGLFDCHSMNGVGPYQAPDAGRKRKDIVLGNNGDPRGNASPARGQTTCSPKTVKRIREALQAAGFSVALNDPYPGGFITTHYARQMAGTGRFALQIEINQDLYLEPSRKEPIREQLVEIRNRIARSFEEIAAAL